MATEILTAEEMKAELQRIYDDCRCDLDRRSSHPCRKCCAVAQAVNVAEERDRLKAALNTALELAVDCAAMPITDFEIYQRLLSLARPAAEGQRIIRQREQNATETLKQEFLRAEQRGADQVLREVAKLPSPIKSYSQPPMRMVTGRQCLLCRTSWKFTEADEDPNWHPPSETCLWPRALAAQARQERGSK